MARVLSDKDIQNLIKKVGKVVEQKKKKERPSYDESIVRSDKAENQEDLDDQFKYMKRRSF